nr:immunoglobulin heavy chain junction region [Mus musculus]
CARTRQDFDYW